MDTQRLFPGKKCPSPELLNDFVVGNVNESTGSEIADHLESCSACVRRLSELPHRPDRLIQSLQALAAETVVGHEDTEKEMLDAERRAIEIGVGAERDRSEGNPASSLGPKTIGPYELIRQIGSGGMGIVYLARHRNMRRLVALKILPSHAADNASAFRRFEREMQAVGRLSHRNIVSGYDAGESNGHCYLAMEFLSGVDLSTLARLQDDPLAECDACELIRQTALALDYAHQHGIVHRDVKPSNIMLCSESESDTDSSDTVVKLLDLGLARFEQPDPSDESMTSLNQMVGTLDYMSPEQCLDSRDVDARSDIYSLGVTLYRLLTGRPPWTGKEYQTQGQKVKALLSQQVPSVENLRPELSPHLVQVVRRCVERDREQRYQSMQEVVDALQPLADGHDLNALLDNASNTLQETDFIIDSVEAEARAAEATRTRSTQTLAGVAAAEQESPPKKIWRLALAFFPLCFAAAAIIWLKTNGGYLRIKADPGVNIQVEVIRNGELEDTLQVGSGENTYWYRSGDYEIRVPAAVADQLTLKGDRFTLHRGDRPVLSISRVTEAQRAGELASSQNDQAGPETRTPKSIHHPDRETDRQPIDRREIVRWVVNNEGDVATEFGLIATEADIPTEAFEIHRIAIRDADDEKVKQVCQWLPRLPKCDQLYLNGGRNMLLTDEAMRFIGKAIHLKWLVFESARITDEGIKLLDVMPQVRTVGLLDLLVTERVLSTVNEKFPNLTEINLFCDSLADDDLKPLAEMKNLRSLDFIAPKITNGLFQPVSRSRIDRLWLRGVSEFGDQIGEMLSEMPELQDLRLQNVTFNDDQLEELVAAKKLRFLHLSRTSITVAGLRKYLEQAPQVIVYLEWNQSPLLELKDLPQVKEVNR